MTTTVKMTKGNTMQVKGSFNDVCEGFKSKGAHLFQSRINDNMMIQVNGIVVGQVIKE